MPDSSIALVVVDVQVDFCPGGSLPIPHGDKVVRPINSLLCTADAHNRLVVLTRDWPPQRSAHFATNGGVWPPHCIAGSDGARFHPDLRLPSPANIVSKGVQPGEDGYSGFDGLDDNRRSLLDILKAHSTESVLVCGLATDYCVLATVLDAIRSGFAAIVALDATAPVNLKTTDGTEAEDRMRAAGAYVVSTEEAQRLLMKLPSSQPSD